MYFVNQRTNRRILLSATKPWPNSWISCLVKSLSTSISEAEGSYKKETSKIYERAGEQVNSSIWFGKSKYDKISRQFLLVFLPGNESCESEVDWVKLLEYKCTYRSLLIRPAKLNRNAEVYERIAFAIEHHSLAHFSQLIRSIWKAHRKIIYKRNRLRLL
jgi:hypothetical protein